jgi:hypothetical protein
VEPESIKDFLLPSGYLNDAGEVRARPWIQIKYAACGKTVL